MLAWCVTPGRFSSCSPNGPDPSPHTPAPPPFPVPDHTIGGGGGWERQTPDHIYIYIGIYIHIFIWTDMSLKNAFMVLYGCNHTSIFDESARVYKISRYIYIYV